MKSSKKLFYCLVMLSILSMAFVDAGWFDYFTSFFSTLRKNSIPEFQELVTKSTTFNSKISFPTRDNRIQVIAGNDKNKKQIIISQAKGTYIILHAKALKLITDFLNYKKNYGSDIEKKFYARMTERQCICRLITKRPVVFFGPTDVYLLRDKKNITSSFELIGTDEETDPLLLQGYISYDEMQISSLLGVSVPTYFINDGNRNNRGIKGIEGTYQETGIYVGLVGARFEKANVMEWKHIIITERQNIPERGYGSSAEKKSEHLINIWEQFYEIKFPTFAQAQADTSGRYIKIENSFYGTFYFDTYVYKKRMQMVIEPFLRDADSRGLKVNKKVYVHMVGLGLGVWAIKEDLQGQLIVDVCGEIIRRRRLTNITDLDFSYFPESVAKANSRIKNINDVTIHFSKRNPAAKLTGIHANTLLVACYAWDSNAYSGNEYWMGHQYLSASGDPAAACCSTIAELQNPEINTYFLRNSIRAYGKKK